MPLRGTTDLKTRALASNAVAFVGNLAACGTFNSIAKEVGVPSARVLEIGPEAGGAVRKGNVDFLALLEAVPTGMRWTGMVHAKEDLAIICELKFGCAGVGIGLTPQDPAKTSRAERRGCRRWFALSPAYYKLYDS